MEKRISPNASVKVSFLRKLISQREFILLVVIAFIFIVMSATNYGFFTKQSMLNLLMSFTQNGIIAIGMIILLVSGGMDLSAGYNMAFTGVVTAILYTVVGIPLFPAIILGLVAGLSIGAFNGFMVAIVGLNPFITTLGTSMTFHGLMMMLTRGKSVLVDKPFQVIGQGTLFEIQYPVYILIVLVIIFELLLRRSRPFRTSYYVGGNESAAKLNGINVKKVKIMNYIMTGGLAGLSGILLAARLSTASVGVGGDTALEVITACIIGGASLSGGEGSVLGAFLGVVFIQIVQQSLNMMDLGDLGPYIKIFATGLILLVAITVDVLNERRKAAKITALNEKRIEKA